MADISRATGLTNGSIYPLMAGCRKSRRLFRQPEIMSLFCAALRHENSRFAPRTPCKARICATFDLIRGGLCPLELPLRKRTSDHIERVYRQVEETAGRRSLFAFVCLVGGGRGGRSRPPGGFSLFLFFCLRRVTFVNSDKSNQKRHSRGEGFRFPPNAPCAFGLRFLQSKNRFFD